ncbi:MAG: class I SAM-dependent methyltransferase [Lachnospiraceae bacterium]|nr:class I SAM-dependent methyltransferase [Lachnospiraceae bacterium]
MADITAYYNKFNEDKRLLSRHGQVEFRVTMHYVHELLDELIRVRSMPDNGNGGEKLKIADIGAGTGRYSIALTKEGYHVGAAEPVKYNLGILKKHVREDLPEDADIVAYQSDARKLKHFKDGEFDITLLLGPLYHLHSEEDKIKALNEAKRITKKGGLILAGYVMADYAVIKYGFVEGNIKESIGKGALTEDFGIVSDEEELYDYVRLEDIDRLNEKAGLCRKYIFTPDGSADYMRNVLNEMDEETFELFVDYRIKNALRPELLGAGSHTVDVLVNPE